MLPHQRMAVQGVWAFEIYQRLKGRGFQLSLIEIMGGLERFEAVECQQRLFLLNKPGQTLALISCIV